jgi:Na+/melibiose symporter-like transporter
MLMGGGRVAKKKNKWQLQREREKEKIKQQIKTTKPRPNWMIRCVYFIFISKFGVIPAGLIVFKLTENTFLTRTEWGGFVIFGLMIFLWAFLGLTSNYWYNKRYTDYLELKKKLRNY